jgi:hypothetical protein
MTEGSMATFWSDPNRSTLQQGVEFIGKTHPFPPFHKKKNVSTDLRQTAVEVAYCSLMGESMMSEPGGK